MPSIKQEVAAEDTAALEIAPGMNRWRFGTGEGLIGVDDIILLGFVHISQGKITPLLSLRPDFCQSTIF